MFYYYSLGCFKKPELEIRILADPINSCLDPKKGKESIYTLRELPAHAISNDMISKYGPFLFIKCWSA